MTAPIPNCPQGETPLRERAWTDEQCMEFLSVAMRHVEIKGELRMEEMFDGAAAANRFAANGATP